MSVSQTANWECPVIIQTMAISAVAQSVVTRVAKPFLKWAGGKQQLLAQYGPHFPTTVSRYVEPFVGGGAVYFHLWSAGRLGRNNLLLDNNEELVNVYRVVKANVEALIDALREHKARHKTSYYYEIREMDRGGRLLMPLERAARTIYLNKTCFNGLFRVNSRGEFNVPIGSYDEPSILDEDGLRAASAALQDATIDRMDFRLLLDAAKAGDFIYFDPPYEPSSKTASFTSYTAGNFGRKDQKDLALVFRVLSGIGCFCMLSNSDQPIVRELYAGFTLVPIDSKRAINSDPAGRGAIRELLITSYESRDRD